MSINTLIEKGLLEIYNEEHTTIASDTTLAFAFDSGYSLCFKVMLASMASNGILCQNPIVIYTDDQRILNDPIITLVADRISVLSGEKKDILYKLAKDNVKRPERGNWNRGTFLKWSVFEKQDTERLLFLDVDMLTLSSIDKLLKLSPSTPMVTCPQFQQFIKTENTEQNLQNLLEGNFDNKHKSRINSGVMLINQALLSDNFFNEITTFASQRLSIHEQGLLSEYFSKNREMITMAPSKYNYQDSYLRLAKDDLYSDLLNHISIIHYAGGIKPWLQNSNSISHLPSIKTWHQYSTLAKKIL